MSSLNHYMHSRNPFKVKPDYNLLAEKYPSFKEFLVSYSTSSSKFKINFKDPNALRCLSTVLLKDKFDLDVEIPLDRLIPSIPQRLNYILWIEDIIDKCYADTKEKKINLIDCGTGASYVFPLISTKLNSNWYFLATELDDYSLDYAKRNCKLNNLENRIKVIKGKQDQLILGDLNDQFVALMCNPPFFEERNEDCRASTSNTSQLVESIVDGGEEKFVLQLIEESLVHKNEIQFYTVMLGRKTSFKNLMKKLQFLKQDGILNFINTEFCQGKTVRWGLCWTFDLSMDLNSFENSDKSHPKSTR